jgi:hypothetical protein
MSSLLAAIAFDPTIRGIMICVVSVGVLCGSIYLIISTNTGPRLGFLIAGAGLFGWCFLMGIIWWIYGIGFMGRAPAWHGIEVNFDRTQQLSLEEAQTLPPSEDLPPSRWNSSTRIPSTKRSRWRIQRWRQSSRTTPSRTD